MNVNEVFQIHNPVDSKWIPKTTKFSAQRVNDNTIEFEMINQSLQLNKIFDAEKKITKKVRVILPGSEKQDIKKYYPIFEKIIAQASGKAAKQGRAFTEKDLKNALIKGKKTGLHWKITDKQSSFFCKILRFLSWIGLVKFLHRSKKAGVVELTLKEYLPWYRKILNLFSKKRRALVKAFKTSQKIPVKNLNVHSTTEKKSFVENFNSPFTQLATHAYKYLEKDFVNHDYKEINTISSHFVFSLKEGKLTLINKADLKTEHSTSCKLAAEEYKRSMLKEYGKEKLDYMMHLARIELNNLEKLTPEHVYRLNILACNVEKQDIQSLLYKMLFIRSSFVEPSNDDLQETLLVLNTGLSHQELKGIVNWTRNHHELTAAAPLTVKHFLEALDSLPLKKNLHYKMSMIESIIANDSSIKEQNLLDYLKDHPKVRSLFEDKSEFNTFISRLKLFFPLVEKPDSTESFWKLFKSMVLTRNLASNDKTSETLLDLLQKSPEFKVDSNALFDNRSNLILKDFVDSLDAQDKILSSKTMNQLIAAVFPTQAEKNKAYTGRKIVTPIESYYSIADRRFYKAPVDQQELSQILDQMQNEKKIDPYDNVEINLDQKTKERRFYEWMTHVVCKKHLFRQHPKGYQVGAIIPAPSKEDGTKRYYYVDRMVANNEGLLFYVFEPLGNDSDLPTLIVPRSTASDLYAYNGLESFRNDVNTLNAPGYEGRRHLTPYLKDVRKDHTIPVWVGYQHAASEMLNSTTPIDIDVVRKYLANAKQTLEEMTLKKHRSKSLHQIVKEFDSELNDLFWYNTTIGTLWKKWLTPLATERSKYERIITSFANGYTKQSIAKETEAQKTDRLNKEKEGAEFIIFYFNKFAQKNAKGELSLKHRELVNALERNILNRDCVPSDEEILEKHLPEEVQKAFKEIDSSTSERSDLYNCTKVLKEYAISLGEDVESKKKNGITLAGHSLGGATAQTEAYYQTFGTDRMPVPNTSMKVVLYDDPGMNEEDNVDMYEKVFAHTQVMKDLKVAINVYHSHDYGDVIPMGAPAHLGGINRAVRASLSSLMLKAIEEDEKTTEKPLTKKFKIQKRNLNDDNFQQSSLSEIYHSGEFGKNIIFSFFMDEMLDVFKVDVELKKTTKRALEPETADIYYKHGTRFESSRTEKSRCLKIALEAKKQLSLKKEFVNFRTIAEFIRSELKSDTENTTYTNFLFAFDAYQLLTKIVKGKNKNVSEAELKGLQDLSLRFPSIYNFNKNSVQNFKPKHLSKVKVEIQKHFKDYLHQAKLSYKKLLEKEISKTLQEGIGDVKLTYLDPAILGGAGGEGCLSVNECRQIWGGGALDPKRIRRIAKLVGINLGPFIFPSIASAKSRDLYISTNGHGAALKHEDPIYGTLVVDAALRVI